VISQDIWGKAVTATLATLGIPSSPLTVHITGVLRGKSGAFGEAQKQCPDCETPGSVAKTGTAHPEHGANLSLIQRGKLPDADMDPSIVGQQFGGTSSTPAEREAITAAHVKKVVGGLRREMRGDAKKFASDSAAAICDPTQQQDIFIATLEATVRALAR
jgi:hypothetical protein